MDHERFLWEVVPAIHPPAALFAEISLRLEPRVCSEAASERGDISLRIDCAQGRTYCWHAARWKTVIRQGGITQRHPLRVSGLREIDAEINNPFRNRTMYLPNRGRRGDRERIRQELVNDWR
jgi:hypothetical protein